MDPRKIRLVGVAVVKGIVLVVAVFVLLLGGCTQTGRGAQAASRTATAAPAAGAKTASPGDSIGEIVSGGETRRYRLYVPGGYQQGGPLVINLHGLGETPAQQEMLSGMSRKADEAGFVVAYPEGQGSPVSWDLGPGPRGKADVDFVRDLVHRLEGDLRVDPARVYATGISNGGGMVSHLGCEAADTFAAIAPVSGAYLLSESCRPSRPVPVLAFHGTGDRVVPYDGQGRVLPPVRDWAAGWASRDGCTQGPRQIYQNGDVAGESWEGCREDAAVTLYTIKDGGHTWPGAAVGATKDIDATDVIWRFFADHAMRR